MRTANSSISRPICRTRPKRLRQQCGIESEKGFKVSRFQGFKVSRFQGFKVSRFQGFKVSRFQGFKVSRFQDFTVKSYEPQACFFTLGHPEQREGPQHSPHQQNRSKLSSGDAQNKKYCFEVTTKSRKNV